MAEYRNARKHYRDEDIEELFVLSQRDDYYDRERLERASEHYGRSPRALEFAMRWGQGASFPPEALGRIKRQMDAAREKLKKPSCRRRVVARLRAAGLLGPSES